MYQTLLFIHNTMRWLIIICLLLTLLLAFQGYIKHKIYSKLDGYLRLWTTTLSHIQLIIGMTLYIKSPLIKYFFANFKEAIQELHLVFFGLIHTFLMLVAIVCLTIGSATSKRKHTDQDKFRMILIWFILALLIILIAIPWPFSPLAQRPYVR